MNMVEMKRAYQDKADAQLREWQEWIEHFSAEPAVRGSGQSRANQQRCLERLEDCQRAARSLLDDLCSAQDDRWELAKQAVERAMIELKHVMDESGVIDTGKLVQLQTNRSRESVPFYKSGPYQQNGPIQRKG